MGKLTLLLNSFYNILLRFKTFLVSLITSLNSYFDEFYNVIASFILILPILAKICFKYFCLDSFNFNLVILGPYLLAFIDYGFSFSFGFALLVSFVIVLSDIYWVRFFIPSHVYVQRRKVYYYFTFRQYLFILVLMISISYSLFSFNDLNFLFPV